MVVDLIGGFLKEKEHRPGSLTWTWRINPELHSSWRFLNWSQALQPHLHLAYMLQPT